MSRPQGDGVERVGAIFAARQDGFEIAERELVAAGRLTTRPRALGHLNRVVVGERLTRCVSADGVAVPGIERGVVSLAGAINTERARYKAQDGGSGRPRPTRAV